jgi:hypothetical protein
MSLLAKCLLCALCTTFVLAGAKAQEVSQGTGVLCDTKQQIERFVSLEANSVALQTINADEQKTVCAVVEVQYVRGISLGKLRNTKGTFEAAEILILAANSGGWHRIPPEIQYTIFAVVEEGA